MTTPQQATADSTFVTAAQDVTETASATSGSRLAGTNFAFMWTESLNEGFGHLTRIGLDRVELTVSLPHIDLRRPLWETAHEVRSAAEQYGVSFTSLNPVEMNLISANAAVADTTTQQLKATVDLAAELGAPTVVVVPGRMNSLCPMHMTTALDSFHRELEGLLEHAIQRGVSLALENTPFGFLQSPTELVEQIQRYDHERLGLVVDAANLEFLGLDTAAETRAAADHLILAHISDTDRRRFAHAHVGEGTVDFAAFATLLAELGYTGDTVNELVTPAANWARWEADTRQLRNWGWK